MNLKHVGDSEARFAAYVEGLASVIGHADRQGPLWDYCVGLVMPGERKSVEPMAAVTAPGRVAAQLRFKTKQEIALEQIRWACEAGIPRGIALMDADYGRNAELRRSITAQE